VKVPSDEFLKAQSLLDLGRSAQAADLLRRVLADEPDHEPAMCLLAVAESQLGEPETALRTIDRALALAPDRHTSHRLRADILLQLGRRREAVGSAREAVRLQPNDWAAHAMLAYVLVGIGRYRRQASAAAARALALAPQQPQAFLAVAQVALARGRVGKALNVLRRALAVAPDDPELLMALAQLHYRRGRPVAALNLAGGLAASHPTTRSLRERLIASSWDLVALVNVYVLAALLIGLVQVAGEVGPQTADSVPARTSQQARLVYTAAVLVVGAAAVWWVWAGRLTAAARQIMRWRLSGRVGLFAAAGPLTGVLGLVSLVFANRATDVRWLGPVVGVTLLAMLAGVIVGLIWPSFLARYTEGGGAGTAHRWRRRNIGWQVLGFYAMLISFANIASGGLGDRADPLATSTAVAGIAGLLAVELSAGWALYRSLRLGELLRRPAGYLYAVLIVIAAVTPAWLPLSPAYGSTVQLVGVGAAWSAAAVAAVSAIRHRRS
jgi:Flp pilus assembly protein TadD